MSARTFPDLPDWRFETDEVSASVYKVVGRDSADRTVSATGTDPEALLQQCLEDARRIMTSRRTGGH